MSIGIFRTVMAAFSPGFLLTAHLVIASPASADCSGTIAKAEASEAADLASSSTRRTGDCWQHAGSNYGVSSQGAVCLPGSIGMCLANLQNGGNKAQSQPTTQPIPSGANPAATWP